MRNFFFRTCPYIIHARNTDLTQDTRSQHHSMVRSNQDIPHFTVKTGTHFHSHQRLGTVALFSRGLYFPAHITRMWGGSGIWKCTGVCKARDTPSSYPFVPLSVHPSVCPSIHLFVHLLSICLYCAFFAGVNPIHTHKCGCSQSPESHVNPLLQTNKWNLKRLRGFSKVTHLPGRRWTDHIL